MRKPAAKDSIHEFSIHLVSQEYGSNEVWFIHQEDGRRLHHRLGECLPDPHQGCTMSIHKYDQAYHDKHKKQQDNCNKIACP